MIQIDKYSKNRNVQKNLLSTSKGTIVQQNEVQGINIWGQYHDHTSDINGDLTSVGTITGNKIVGNDGTISGKLTSGDIESPHAKITNVESDSVVSKDGTITNLNTTTLSAITATINKLLSTNITTENLTVTKAAHFFKLIIDEIKASQGQIIITPANATIDKVVTLSNGNFKCYFRATDGEDKIYQNFKADDQIVCQTFNAAEGTSYNVSNKFYWRLCTQVSTATEQTEIDGQNVDCHWIILSNIDKDSQSNSVPESGDNIVMLGNRTDSTRQAAITIGAYNNPYLDNTIKAPFIIQYNGINDYNLASHRLNVISNGINQFKGKFETTTGDDIEQLIDDVGEGVFTYMHVAYSNSASDWSKTYNKEYSYVGFCSNHTESDSGLTYNDYTWSLLKGRDGLSFTILETDYNYTQSQINEYSANGYTGSWVVESTEGINAGQYVNIKVHNVTKNCDAFIVAEVIRVEATTNVRCKSIGVYESGANGTSISISSTEVKYSSVFTAEQPSDSTFTLNSVPTVPQGGYLWTKTKVTYSDGKTTNTYTSSYQGTNGTSVTVTDSITMYAITKIQTQPADSEFIYETIPALSQGDYLWMMTTVTYSDGAKTKSYSVSRIGTDGSDGIKGDNSYLHIAYANSADGSLNFSLTYFINALYIGTYTDNEAEDSSDYTKYTWARLKGDNGQDGEDGLNSVILETSYLITQNSLDAWTQYGDVSEWTISSNHPNIKVGQSVTLVVQNITKNCKAYILGTITSIISNVRIQMQCWGYYQSGTNGTSVSISSTTVKYSSLFTASQPADSTFTLTTQPTVPQGGYLWTMTTVVYSDGNSTKTYMSSYQGKNGTDGTTITNTSIKYAVSLTSTQPADSAFTYTSIPSLSQGDYLWTMTTVTYSDGKTTKSYSVSRIGTDGTDGIDGINGLDGENSYLHIAYANSADGSVDFSLIYFTDALYIGTYTDNEEEDSSDYTKYTWARLKGQDGKDGTDGENGKPFAILITNYSYTQALINEYSTSGYTGSWVVKSTAGTKAGQFISLRMWNSTKKCYSFIVAEILAVQAATNVLCRSIGLYESGANGKDGTDGTSMIMINTSYELTQNTLEAWTTYGEIGGWTIDNTPNLQVGQNVTLIVKNTTRNCKAYIVGVITSIVSNVRINMKCLGYYQSGTNGTDAEYYKLMPIREKAPIDKNGVLGINLAYNIVKVKGLTYTNISATTSTYYVRAKVTKESQLEPSTFNLSVDTETPSYTNSNYQNWKTSVTKVQYITVELVDANGNVKDKRIVYPELTASASFEITDQIISTVQGNYQDLNGKITTNTNSISTLNQKYDQISTTVESHTTSINNINNEIEEQSTDISNLTQRADSISSQVSKYSGVQLINLFGWTKADYSQAVYDNSDQSYDIVKAAYNGHDYYDVFSNVIQLQQGETYTFSFYTEFNPQVSVRFSQSNKLPVEFDTYLTTTRKGYDNDTYLDNPRIAYTFTATNDGYYVIDVGYQDHEEYKSFYRPQLELGDKPTQFDINNQMLSSQIVQTANNILLQVSNCGINIDQRQITLNGNTLINGNLTINDANQGFLLEGNGGKTLITAQSIGTYNEFIQKTAIAQSVSLSSSEPLVKTVESSSTYYTASFRFEKEFGFAKSGSTITVTNESMTFSNNGNLTQYTVTSKQYMVRENDVYKGLLTVGEPFTISTDSTIKIITNLSVRFAKVNDEKQYVTGTLNYNINIPINDAFTLIGYDGLGCNFGNNKTVYIGSEGMIMRYGNAGFQVTNNSLKKMNSEGNWVKLDTKEIKVMPDSNYTLQDNDDMIISNSTMTANRTLYLPSTTYKGRTIYIKDYSQSEIIVNCPHKLISSNSYSASSTINVNNSANMFVYDGNYWLQFKCE